MEALFLPRNKDKISSHLSRDSVTSKEVALLTVNHDLLLHGNSLVTSGSFCRQEDVKTQGIANI